MARAATLGRCVSLGAVMGRRWRIAALSVSLMSSAALGDEYEGPYRPSPSVSPPQVSVFSWTGLYAGGHFGFVYADSQFDYGAAPLPGDHRYSRRLPGQVMSTAQLQ